MPDPMAEEMGEQEKDLLAEVVRGAEKRSIPLIILDAIHANTRLCQTMHITQDQFQREVRGELRTIGDNFGELKTQVMRLADRVEHLETWRDGNARRWGSILGIVLTAVLSAIGMYLATRYGTPGH